MFNGITSDCKRNFFKDLHGPQQINIQKKTEETCCLNAKSQYEILEDYLKNQCPQPNGLKSLISIKKIRNILNEYLLKTTYKDHTNDITIMAILQLIKKGLNGITKKLPQKDCEKIKEHLDFIKINLPENLFNQKSDNLDIENEIKSIDQHLIFHIPMNEIDPFIDTINNSNTITMLPTEIYPITKRYNDFKENLTEFPLNEFQNFITTQLNSSKTNEEIFNELLDTLGCELFEFINEIVQNRSNKFDWMVDKVVKKIEKKRKTNQRTEKTSITLQRTREKLDLPHVHDQLRNISVTTKFNGVALKHPENTIKIEEKSHIEFTIPGTKPTGADSENFQLIDISGLDSIGRLVFKDIKRLNRIQSEVFPTAYTTNENMLICAPTGAGKTNIALLAIVHQIKLHMDGGFIRKDDFKIVYVCPMKALATEMMMNFRKKLSSIGIIVKEVTGDMQLTKKEIAETQILVTTPEKWDVISRKGAVDSEVTSLVKLLILDEVHLLNSDRGPVIEALVARTLRQVLSSQNIIRIVALSATLPGYLDVADFLKVNPRSGLFFFDNRYRSVPLTMTFIGMKNKNDTDAYDMICYRKIIPLIESGHQAMVFVTSRNLTNTVATNLMGLARADGRINAFMPERSLNKTFRSLDLQNLVPYGFGTHHAGMCRSDRLEIENLFRSGILKVIVCTTTLAWGVNLPAHAVIIRGTTRYDAQKSQYVDMDMLDVQQIFGRAGRPQYDTSGHGMIITGVNNMINYMALLMSQTPIESQFLNRVPDNLNAEIVLGTVSNLKEAMEWLTNTFLYCRIKKNPLVYGLTLTEVWENDRLFEYLERKLEEAAKILEKSHMIRFDTNLGELRPTNYGRIASFYYITHETMSHFHEHFTRHLSEIEIIYLISRASEFAHIQLRNDELDELDRLNHDFNAYNVEIDTSSATYKVLVLIQATISRAKIRLTSLISDCEFIMQSVQRLARALFEIAVDKNYGQQVARCLIVAQMVEQRTWNDQHPLLQFKELEIKNAHAYDVLDGMSIDDLRVIDEKEAGLLLRNRAVANRVRHFAKTFPRLVVDLNVKPITEGVVRIQVILTADFIWDNNLHGNVQHYYAWVEDAAHDCIYHFESFVLTKKIAVAKDHVELIFTVPLIKPHSDAYYVVVVNSKYMHTNVSSCIDLEKIHLLPSRTTQTKFLCVRPLPKTALSHQPYENLYPFTHFNAVQSQIFHTCYHTDTNVLLGAPTGSGKTIVAELCVLRLFRLGDANTKVVYVAPMKALVRERMNDWLVKFGKIGKKVVEMTGDVTPNSDVLANAAIIITTPEKWDGMSRNWMQRRFVKDVGLVIIDEIHLLAEERGPVLEVIVSRMNYINSVRNGSVRIVGLSTAMANAGDLANWLGIEGRGLYNFSSSVRPVPLEIHLQGFAVKNYCPRMAAMNKPAYQSICQYAPDSPTLIFVSSRKQTRITSYDLIKCLMGDTNPRQWLHIDVDEMENLRANINDPDLSYLLMFGIGIHHAGLQENDRKLVEDLFVRQKIQVLVATATLAWGVNFPAHLVIVKGTEYYDPATKRYVDMPVTDVLQMMGRAGRPQYDTSGVACVFVQENKKNFYRKFLFEPFPVESSLLQVLPEHVNAEIANGTIGCKTQLLNFICSTFFFRRLLVNPTYYGLMDVEKSSNDYLNELADSVIGDLIEKNCILIDDVDGCEFFLTTFLGNLAAQYYLSCKTVVFLMANMIKDCSFDDLLMIVCQVEEYALFPVRHNEDKINKHLTIDLNLKTKFNYDSPQLKVLILIKCYLIDKKMPNQEYVVDLKTVFDQIVRILQAMISLSSENGWTASTLKIIYLTQMLMQGLLLNDDDLQQLPHLNRETINCLKNKLNNKHLLLDNILNLANLRILYRKKRTILTDIFREMFDRKSSDDVCKILSQLPILDISITLKNANGTRLIPTYISLNYNLNMKMHENFIDMEFLIKRDGGHSLNVYSKRFSKQKEECWFFVLVTDDDLVKFQRFIVRKQKMLDVRLNLPQQRGIYNYHAYFMSDSYIGLDQKINFSIKID